MSTASQSGCLNADASTSSFIVTTDRQQIDRRETNYKMFIWERAISALSPKNDYWREVHISALTIDISAWTTDIWTTNISVDYRLKASSVI